MRSAAGYVLAGVLGVGLLALGVVVLVLGVRSYGDRVEGFERISLEERSGGTLDLDEGGHSIYFEPADGDTGRGLHRDPPILVQVRPGETGAALPVETYDTEVTYGVSGYDGVGLYTFDVEEAGPHLVAVAGETGGVAGARGLGTVAVGRGIGTDLAGSLVTGIGLLALGPVLGAVLAVATATRRSRARRRAAPPSPAWS